MNLAEVIVATAVFLGACNGAAQMGVSSAEAMSQSRARMQVNEQMAAQLLAVAPVIAAGQPAISGQDCWAAAQWMQHQLEAGLPPQGPGLQRRLELNSAADQVLLTLEADAGLRRQRLLSPAAYGLCGRATASVQTFQPIQEVADGQR